MSGFYTGLACLVLFDARGSCGEAHPHLPAAALCAALVLLGLKYLPAILHRPQQLVDALCADVLCIAVHAAGVSLVTDPCLRHGCSLHSACFVAQQRFVGRMPSLTAGTAVHTLLALGLLAAYAYGPRIGDVRQFMLSAVCPHAFDLLAQIAAHAHRVAVMWCEALDAGGR